MSAPYSVASASPPKRRGLVRPSWTLVLLLAAFLLLRLPSWFEPHWYTDEAGYAATAWLSLHGSTLYSTVWNNKPPLLFWSYGLVLNWFGPSELGLHLMSTLLGLVAIGGLWQLAKALLPPRRAAFAVLLAVLLLGLPILNGELALPESLLIAPGVWGMVATVRVLRPGGTAARIWWGALAGALFAAAILYQQTAAAIALAAALWLLLLPRRSGWVQLATMILVAMALVAAALAPYLIWAGAGNVFYFLVTSYGGYARSSLGLTFGTVIPRAVALLAIPICAAIGRSEPEPRWRLVWIWLAATALTAALPNRPYDFFTIPLVFPLVLALAAVRWPARRSLGELTNLVRRRGAPVVAALIAVVLWGSVLVTGGSLSGYTVGLTLGYYPNFAGRVVGAVSPETYSNFFDYRVLGEKLAADWIRRHGLAGSSGLAWSSDAWVYLLADLRPVVPTPALYVDEMWLGPQGVMNWVEAKRPIVVVTTPSSTSVYPQIVPYLKQYYLEVYRPGESEVWVRKDKVPKGVSPIRS